MHYLENNQREEYIEKMKALSRMCREIHLIQQSSEYTQGVRVQSWKRQIKDGPLKCIVNKCKNVFSHRQLKKNARPISRPKRVAEEANYFSDDRIAVYTCIFGKYDKIQRPVSYPDNIDYYIITDFDIPDDCGWKKYDIGKYESKLANMTNVEKNRWFKMHPHIVFEKYRYSIYVDGNIVPVTDFTEFVNRIKNVGIAMFWHSYNNCIYEEAIQNKYFVKKISSREVDIQVKYLRENNMPEGYGMTTCNVIARDHSNPICRKLMDDWWNEFINHCRRDQLSFPFVVWKNDVSMADIAVLGDDVWNTDTLLVVQHTY